MVENQSNREDSLGEDHKRGQGPTWAVEPRSKVRCQCSLGGVSSSVAQKIHEETICKIPDSKNLHVTFDEEQMLP
jgi:hypothetical protein